MAVCAAVAGLVGIPAASATYGVGYQVYAVDATGGAPRSLSDGAHPDRSLTVSRSGRLAFVRETSTRQRTDDVAGLWTAGADGAGARRIVPLPSDCDGCIGPPAWSPDGAHLAFVRAGVGAGLWVVEADGGNLRRLTSEASWSALLHRPPAWLPDGRSLVYEYADPAACRVGEHTNCAEWTVRLMRVAGGVPRELARDARDPAVSPDGRWVAYQHVDGGDSLGLYVLRTDGSGWHAVWPKLSVGGHVWAPGGARIFFNWRDGLYSIGRDGKTRRRVGPPAWPIAWSPRRDRVALAYWAADSPYVWTMRGDGRGRRRLARTDGAHPPESLAWSRDGRKVYFTG